MMGKTQSTQEIRILQYSKIRDEAFDIFKKKIVIMEMLLLTMGQ